jgi:hypothetical protein
MAVSALAAGSMYANTTYTNGSAQLTDGSAGMRGSGHASVSQTAGILSSADDSTMDGALSSTGTDGDAISDATDSDAGSLTGSSSSWLDLSSSDDTESPALATESDATSDDSSVGSADTSDNATVAFTSQDSINAPVGTPEPSTFVLMLLPLASFGVKKIRT